MICGNYEWKKTMASNWQSGFGQTGPKTASQLETGPGSWYCITVVHIIICNTYILPVNVYPVSPRVPPRPPVERPRCTANWTINQQPTHAIQQTLAPLSTALWSLYVPTLCILGAPSKIGPPIVAIFSPWLPVSPWRPHLARFGIDESYMT